MTSQLLNASAAGAFMLVSITVANAMYDTGVSQYLARKVGHVAAGIVFILAPVMFKTAWVPVSLSIAFTFLMLASRRWAPNAIRGIGGSGRSDAMAEVWYPFACAVAVAVGWGLLHNPWLGVLPTLFLGFGDAITGAIRIGRVRTRSQRTRRLGRDVRCVRRVGDACQSLLDWARGRCHRYGFRTGNDRFSSLG